MAEKLFLGEFVVGNITYEVIEEDYEQVPDDTPAEYVIRAAKHIAIARQAKTGRSTNQFRESDFSFGKDDPIPRFIGNILLFDANNLAYRCRYAYDLSHNGEDVSVLFGFLKVLSSTIRKFGDVKVVVACWDGGVPAYRKEAQPEYKASRDHSDDETYRDFVRQVRILHNFLPKLGVSSVRKRNCEADDLIAKAAKVFHGDYLKIIVSSDKDLLQCVASDVHTYHPIKDQIITLQTFYSYVGVDPKEYLIYKCLVGDSSDNLKGCMGIGDKWAKQLLQTYGASASNMVNVATGKNPDADPMPAGIAKKISKFGLTGFANMMKAIRLDHDLCGAGSALLSKFEEWETYDFREVKKFLMSHGFVSLLDPDFYGQFTPLRSPERVLHGELGAFTRIPAIAPLREPLSVSEEE